MQDTVAPFGEAAMRRCGVEFGNLGFQVLVDQQQRLQRAAEIPIAVRHDLIDGGLIRSKTHPNPLPCPWGIGQRRPICPCAAMRKRSVSDSLSWCAPGSRKSADHGYKMADDAVMTNCVLIWDNSVAPKP